VNIFSLCIFVSSPDTPASPPPHIPSTTQDHRVRGKSDDRASGGCEEPCLMFPSCSLSLYLYVNMYDIHTNSLGWFSSNPHQTARKVTIRTNKTRQLPICPSRNTTDLLPRYPERVYICPCSKVGYWLICLFSLVHQAAVPHKRTFGAARLSKHCNELTNKMQRMQVAPILYMNTIYIYNNLYTFRGFAICFYMCCVCGCAYVLLYMCLLCDFHNC
jgi:hypothetical protein